MAEIEITLPTVQYGNIKIAATPEEWGLETIADAPDVGVWAATYLNLFQQGFKHGATLDVDAHLGASQGVTEAQAQRYLDEGLGGVTEVEESRLDEYNDDGPDDVQHAANEARDAAPWDNPQVDAKPKPWENKSAAPAAKPVVTPGW